LVVGDGPERGRLERRSQQTSLADRIHFAGHRRNIASIMKSCELLLLTSQWEGMPNVVLEAMAAGIPVATFDVEGAAELLGSTAQQQLVARGGDEQTALQRLSQCVEKIAGDQEFRRRLGQSNRQRAAEFSLDKMVARYQEFFDQQINQAGTTSSLGYREVGIQIF
jgi:glycosyltransferase involved in cell wall biosynthesis